MRPVTVVVPLTGAPFVQSRRLVDRVTMIEKGRTYLPFVASRLTVVAAAHVADPAGSNLIVEVAHELVRLAGGAVARDHRSYVAGQVGGRAQIQEVQALFEQAGRVYGIDGDVAGQRCRSSAAMAM